jgi:transcriptional regulator with XRE-family HTH domain
MAVDSSVLPNAEKIRELRERRAWSQRELAEHCNMDERSVRRAESGVVNVRISKLRDVATALGVPLNVIRAAGDEDEVDDKSARMLSVRRCFQGSSLYRYCVN